MYLLKFKHVNSVSACTYMQVCIYAYIVCAQIKICTCMQITVHVCTQIYVRVCMQISAGYISCMSLFVSMLIISQNINICMQVKFMYVLPISIPHILNTFSLSISGCEGNDVKWLNLNNNTLNKIMHSHIHTLHSINNSYQYSTQNNCKQKQKISKKKKYMLSNIFTVLLSALKKD